jgi:hypothetical protein
VLLLVLYITQIDAEALQQRALASGYRVVLDMAFRDLMTEKERLSMRSQVCPVSFYSTAAHLNLKPTFQPPTVEGLHMHVSVFVGNFLHMAVVVNAGSS